MLKSKKFVLKKIISMLPVELIDQTIKRKTVKRNNVKQKKQRLEECWFGTKSLLFE
jgi:hypothetical protein